MFHRFRVWFCWKVLGRTPYHWEDFGRGVRRWGYTELDENGKKGVFVSSDEGDFI